MENSTQEVASLLSVQMEKKWIRERHLFRKRTWKKIKPAINVAGQIQRRSVLHESIFSCHFLFHLRKKTENS